MIFKYLRIAALISIPIVLWSLPAGYFDHGEVLCPSKRFLDLECLGCGITRGVQHAMHFELEKAWTFNKLSFIVLFILFLYWLYLLFKWSFDIDLWQKYAPRFLKKSKSKK